MSESGRAREGWKKYWQEGRAASCVAENEATAREIDEHWMRLFAGLPDGSRILDIATGNGAVLAYAARAAERAGKRYSLTGIDAAAIRPLRHLRNPPAGLEQARFMGGVAAEEMPLEDASFDVVRSQYGLEHADLDRARPEIERVLAARGQLFWLAHRADSLVVRQNRDQSD